jgi:hypothetical protein
MIDREALETEIIRAMSAAGEHPMQWGKDDCALWCANILRPITGYDAAADFRGHYGTARGARRALGKGGLPAALKRAARRHKWIRVPASCAQTGDIGLILTEHGAATVICRARGWFVGRDQRGYMGVPAHMVRVAWSIDRDVIDRVVLRHSFPRMLTRPAMVQSSALLHEPISDAILLTALIESVGVSAPLASAIGGAIVSSAIAIGLSLVAHDDSR